MRARAVERKVWAGMLQRCGNPSAENYSLYGGRGIRVCKRWCESFDAFYEDMGPRPGAGYREQDQFATKLAETKALKPDGPAG